MLYITSIYRNSSNQGRILKIHSYNTLGDVVSTEISIPGEVMNALDRLTALSCSLGSSDESSGTAEDVSEYESINYQVDGKQDQWRNRMILQLAEGIAQGAGDDSEEEDRPDDDDDDNSGSFFNLSKKLNKLCKKYNVMTLYNINRCYNNNIAPKSKHESGQGLKDEFDGDFEVIEEDNESSSHSGNNDNYDIYRIDSWLKQLKTKPEWKSQIHESYLDLNNDLNTSYDINDADNLSQSPSPVGSYFDMQGEIDSRMDLLRQDNSLSYVQLEEICSCCVYDLQDRINKCMYVKPMPSGQSNMIPRPPPPPPLTRKTTRPCPSPPPPPSATVVIYPSQHYTDEDKGMFPSLSSSTLKSLFKYVSSSEEDDDTDATPTGSQSESYFDIREQFDNCMEILRLEETLSFIRIKDDSSTSSD